MTDEMTPVIEHGYGQNIVLSRRECDQSVQLSPPHQRRGVVVMEEIAVRRVGIVDEILSATSHSCRWNMESVLESPGA